MPLVEVRKARMGSYACADSQKLPTVTRPVASRLRANMPEAIDIGRKVHPAYSAGNEAFVLELRGVSCSFGATRAVNQVNLGIRHGEFLTLLGPSGCGKTSLLRLIAGFEQPSAGEILIGARSMRGVPPYRRPIGVVFQNYALFPHLSVRGNVAFGLEVQRRPRAQLRTQVDAMLESVGLLDYAERSVHQLSGGQRQRVALARALIIEPTVLLLDEPLSALDVGIRRQMQLELKALQRRSGTTFVFVTHDQDEALILSDRIAVCNSGQIEQLGTPREIYLMPSTRFVAAFVGEANILPADVREGKITLEGLETAIPLLPLDSYSKCAVAIRPENIAIGDHALSCDVQLSAMVVETAFMGTTLLYKTQLANGAVLTVRVPMHRDHLQHAAGEGVRVGWKAADLSLVTA